MSDSHDHADQQTPSRRRFLRDTSLGLGAAMAIPGVSMLTGPGRARAAENNQRKIRFALVGLGSLSTNQLAPAFEKAERCELAGIVTGTPSKAVEWSKKYDIPQKNIYNYENYDSIADNDDIDVLYIVLPNSMHAEYTIRGAQAGKHILCEKPMATSSQDCEKMIEACEKANRKLAIGYRLHFEPYNQEMMRLGQEEVFGPTKLVEASFAFPIGDPTQWRLDKQMAGGGPLMDVGIYALNASRYVTGEEPISVTAQAFPKTNPQKFDQVEETLAWQLIFPSGAVANSTTSYNARVNRLQFSGRGGWAELDPAYSYGGLKGRASRGPMDFPEVDEFAAEMDDFADCIINDKQSRVSGEEGLRDQRILEAIYEAAESGKKIDLA